MNHFRFALMSVVVPVLFAAIGVGLQLAWLPTLPATIATHWSISGAADGFGPSWSMPVLLGVLGLAVTVVVSGVVAFTTAATGVWPLILVAVVVAVSLPRGVRSRRPVRCAAWRRTPPPPWPPTGPPG